VAHGTTASQDELDAIADLVRRIRRMTEHEAVKRGRPILVAARVPDSVEYAKAQGLDVERWLAEGLIDRLIGSGYFRLNRWQYLVQLGHKYGAKVCPCLGETRVGGWLGRDRDRTRASDPTYRARAANCWRAGADGIYIFNEYNARRASLRDIGDLRTLDRKPKLYYVTVRDGAPGRYVNSGSAYGRRPMLCPSAAKPVSHDAATEIDVMVGTERGARNPVSAESQGRE